jgi:hypothetical protein
MDLATRLLALGNLSSPQARAQLQAALAPRVVVPDEEPFDPGTGDRESLRARLIGCLVAEQIAAVLDFSLEGRGSIDALLNQPFPNRRPITIEHLDLQTARIQSLEQCVRCLAAVIVELVHPSDREVASVSVSSADVRRRA